MASRIRVFFRYCCAPSAYDSVTVHCDGFDMLVYMVMECECFECAEPPLVYAGIAMTSDGDPLMYVKGAFIKLKHSKIFCFFVKTANT